MTMGTIRAFSIAAAILILSVGGILYYSKHQSTYASIVSFKECEEAGFTVVQSVPQTCATPDGRIFAATVNATSTNTTSTSTATSTNVSTRIRGVNVAPNQLVTSPLVVTGEANWYFEGSFPVQLLDGNGKVLAIGPATAKSDWMTTNLVPFSITLSFAKPTTATGTLILQNDNPSGLPENALELRIPVRFVTSTNQ